MTDRQLIEHIQMLMLADAMRDPQDAVHFEFRGPFTTMYWNKAVGDNVSQQSMTVTTDGKSYEIIVREKN